jgi:hypothetical protein
MISAATRVSKPWPRKLFRRDYFKKPFLKNESGSPLMKRILGVLLVLITSAAAGCAVYDIVIRNGHIAVGSAKEFPSKEYRRNFAPLFPYYVVG